MATRARHHRRRAAAVWGGAAAVVAATGTGIVLVSWTGASAATSSNGSASTTGGNGQGNNGKGGGNGAGTGVPGKALILSGSATNVLKPGVEGSLVVSITNPNSSAVDVTNVTGSITGVIERPDAAGPAACLAEWYSIVNFTGSQRIAGGGTGTVTLPVRFRNEGAVNQDRCKGATYSFSFAATAQQVVGR